jgi:glycosyltransferase involved in cell wall biosynthesis
MDSPAREPARLGPETGALRIGHVIWSLGLGGAEQIVIHLAAESVRRGHAVTVFTFNEPGVYAPEASAAGVQVVSIPKHGKYDLSVAWRLAAAFRAARLDVVQTHLWGGNVWGRLAAWLAGTPVIVVTEQNLDPWKTTRNFVLDRLLTRIPAHLVGVSGPVRDFYEEHGVGRGRWHVIHNAIPVPPPRPRSLTEAHRALGIVPEDRVVGLVGRLVPAKAPADFLGAVSIALRKVPRLKALLVGDGPLRADVEAEVRRLGIGERVVLAGFRKDVADLLAGMDALVFSSTREGLSLAMLEAMAAGVPLVATRVGGTPELIEHGVTGLLVPASAPEALADEIVRVLTDQALAARLAGAARARVAERFSLAKMADDYEALYRRRPSRSSRA